MSDASKVKINYSLVFIFLSACLFIYIFYRPEGTLVNIVLSDIFPNESLLSLKKYVTNVLPLHELIVYSLPAGLWVFSASILARNLRLRLFKKQINLEWFPMAFALWLEFWQYFGIVKGRFDVADIFIVLIFGFMALVAHRPMQLSPRMLFPFHRRSAAFMIVFVCVFLGHVF
jgi:hypothetical protein